MQTTPIRETVLVCICMHDVPNCNDNNFLNYMQAINQLCTFKVAQFCYRKSDRKPARAVRRICIWATFAHNVLGSFSDSIKMFRKLRSITFKDINILHLFSLTSGPFGVHDHAIAQPCSKVIKLGGALSGHSLTECIGAPATSRRAPHPSGH